ncbi:hypothetical protein [Agromyces badenianii]|uniref:hypothetical protein n=1 Tax=Agromyces badenianii TaxID=2080742 RepID=UPI000D58F859|nr:hypothetical protein [Agromyces badenianii]PWC02845.1 hypothetical protein DCE94_14745 [Agromyces badenianii]
MSTETGRPAEAETIAAEPDGASASVPGVLAEIEARPLAERAEGYQALADQLRTQLEHSDPSLRS